MLHFREEIYPYAQQSMTVDELLYAGRSAYQDVLLFRNQFYGTVLVLDDVVQLSERDEFIYSEMMAHVPLLAHPHPADVLLIGGGDGCVLEEALKHRTVEKVVLVDIDETVIELCRTHFADCHNGAFDDPRFTLRVGDGLAYARDTDEKFDVILVDGPDQTGPGDAGSTLYTPEFCRNCARMLKPGGMLLIQSDVPFHYPQSLALTHSLLREQFQTIRIYTAPVPAYLGANMCFVYAANHSLDVTAPQREARLPDLRYYTSAIHKAAFQLPPYIADIVNKPAAQGVSQ